MPIPLLWAEEQGEAGLRAVSQEGEQQRREDREEDPDGDAAGIHARISFFPAAI